MDFKNLDEYYEYLENDTNFQSVDTDTYQYIRALISEIEDVDNKKQCCYELVFTDFSIENGIPIYKFYNVHSEQGADYYEYILTRANKVQNPKYKAKYNHLLWLRPQKNRGFAEKAIESYLLLLKNSSFSVDDNMQCSSFGKYFKNLFFLSQTINYRKDEIINYLVSLLESDKINDYTKYSLMDFIIENGKKIDSSIIQKFFDYSKNKISDLDERVLENYLKLLVILSRKLNLKDEINEYHEKLGDYHILRLEKEKVVGFITQLYYTNAIEEYKKANNKEKIEQTAVLMEQAKKTIDLKRISVSSEDNEELLNPFNKWWDFTKKKIDCLIKIGKPKDIYQYLILDNLLPKVDLLNDESQDVLLGFTSAMVFDINNNFSKTKSRRSNFYYDYIKNISNREIGLIFIEGIKNKKISYESLIEHLKDKSWYGQDFTYIDSNNETQGFNWIELLSPSLQSFFVQTEIDLKTNSHNPQGYILAIDSLVLKFEGLLREFSRMIGAQTIEIEDNVTKERIKFDKLLNNEKLKALIPEDDIAFFKFLFTPSGMNLRNNVAHCFYTTKNYTSAVMLLLIVALLRLGNYELKTKEKES